MVRTKLKHLLENKWIRKYWKPVSFASTALVLVVGFQNCAKQNFQSLEQASIVSPLSFDGSEQLKINNGAEFTNDTNVGLTMRAPNATQMYITNDSTCSSGGSWEAYELAKAWVLGQSNQQAKVYAKFRDKDLVETKCIAANIIHDNIAPTVTVKDAAPVLTNKNSVVASVEVTDSGSGVDQKYCILPGQSSTLPCDGSYDGKNLSDGPHMVQFSAVDKAGNSSEIVPQSFTVDTTAPTVDLNQTPQALTGSLDAAFGFSGSDALSGLKGFECKLDQGSYADCASGLSYAALVEDVHSFSVRSIDNAGNVSAGVEYSWKIDRSQPMIRFTQTPASITNTLMANFAFEGQDSQGNAISKFECSLNGGAFANCSSPASVPGVIVGDNTFAVRGVNNLGIPSADLSYQWKVDLTPPSVKITQGPALLTNSLLANFVFTATDENGIASVTCSHNGGAAVNCASLSQSYAALEPNREHTFEVTATDVAGNSKKSAPYKWTIDTLPPSLQITGKPDVLSSSTTANFQILATDANGPITYKCGIDTSNFSACLTNFSQSGLSDKEHIFYAQAQDAAGNLSEIKTYTWTIKTIGPALAFTQTPAPNINSNDQGILTYTISDPIANVTSSTCKLDTTNLPCTLSGATLTFPTLPVGPHSFTLTATNSLGLTSTLTHSFNVNTPPCVPDLEKTDRLTKILFVVDASKSNQFKSGCSVLYDDNCTDPGKKMRVGSITAFHNRYGAKANIAWGFNVFQGSSSLALINSGGNQGTPIFSNSAAMANAITYFKNSIKDDGGTPYGAALDMATNAISRDPDLNNATKNPQYIVVFMSDGMPDGNPSVQSVTDRVKTLMDLGSDRITFNTIYYGPKNDSASNLLYQMSTTGKGKFLNTNANPTGLDFEIIDHINVPTCR